MAEAVSGADLRDRPPRRPFRPLVAEREQLVVGLVGADLAVGLLDPFLDLGQERVRDPAPVSGLGDRLARVAGRDVPGDRVV